MKETKTVSVCPPTVEQDEPVAVAALQRLLQDVLQGPEEEQHLLPALGLPKPCAALLGHVVHGQQRRRVLHHTLVALFTHTQTHSVKLVPRERCMT